MKIIIACDSFKGSLSSNEVAHNIITGIERVSFNNHFHVITMADGGEGTVDAIINNCPGEKIRTVSINALGRKIESEYGIMDNGAAIIEMAAASGLTLVDHLDIVNANTYGTGLLIKDALDRNCSPIYLGIGGSATNDGGIGMANALGIKFYDESNCELPPIPISLAKISRIDLSELDPRIATTKIIAMCDVTNPLCGANGASAIYGPQKGATGDDIKLLDTGLASLADACVKSGLEDNRDLPGSGAAGGLGFGLVTFLNAYLKSGIETVLAMTKFEELLSDCDLVITGEGRIDYQSLSGKVPVGVGKIAKKFNIPVVAIVGSIGENLAGIYDYVDAIESCVVRPCSLEEAIKNADINVINASERIMRLLLLNRD